jgi:hypothetical protein
MKAHQGDLTHAQKNGPEGPFFIVREAFDQLRTGID